VILSCRERGMLGSGAVRDVSLVGENGGGGGGGGGGGFGLCFLKRRRGWSTFDRQKGVHSCPEHLGR